MEFAFGPFALDEDRRQLLRGGREVHLSPKAFELLKLLLEERPRAVSKSELHERLWRDTFVSEVTLASIVAEIRRALGEPARGSRFVRTVHGFGYAFAGEATEAAAVPGRVAPRMPPHWLDCGDRQLILHDGENVLGRDRDAAICLDAAAVSRRHARILIAGTMASIEDLGSKNGTYVRGVRITAPVTLDDGDEIRVGSEAAVYRSMSAPGTTATQLSGKAPPENPN